MRTPVSVDEKVRLGRVTENEASGDSRRQRYDGERPKGAVSGSRNPSPPPSLDTRNRD